jgi:hypothetical protein
MRKLMLLALFAVALLLPVLEAAAAEAAVPVTVQYTIGVPEEVREEWRLQKLREENLALEAAAQLADGEEGEAARPVFYWCDVLCWHKVPHDVAQELGLIPEGSSPEAIRCFMKVGPQGEVTYVVVATGTGTF